MKIKDLIIILQRFNPEMQVIVEDEDNQYSDPHIQPAQICKIVSPEIPSIQYYFARKYIPFETVGEAFQALVIG